MTTAAPRPPVGNYRSAPGNAPRRDPPKETAAPETVASSVTTETPEAAAKSEVELTSKERYAKRLEEAKISKDAANAIFDAVMSKDYYEEYVMVGKQRAVLRTRLYEDHLRLQTALELQRPGLVLSQEDMITRYNLAASLYEWKGVDYKHDNDDDFDAVLTLLRRMPSPVYSLLAQKLAEFDQKVMLVFSEGATDSF